MNGKFGTKATTRSGFEGGGGRYLFNVHNEWAAQCPWVRVTRRESWAMTWPVFHWCVAKMIRGFV